MATQTVLSAPPEEIEKEEMKKMEAEKDCPPPQESAFPAPAESEVKVTEAPVIQEHDTISDEESKGVSTEQKPVELPPLAEAKVDVELPPALAHDTAKSTTEKEDIESESQRQDDDTNVEHAQEKPEETEKVVNVSPAEVIDEKEAGDVKIPEAESTPQEESVPEKIEKVAPEPENVELRSPDDTKLSEKKETCAVQSSDEAKPEAPTIQVEEKHVDSNPNVEEIERAKDTDEVTGQSEEKGVEPGTNETGVAEVKGMATDDAKDTVEVTVVEPGKNETGVAEVKSEVAEELVPCEEKATDSAKDTVEVIGVEPGKNEAGVAEVKSLVAEELVPCEEKATNDTVEVTGVDTGKNETGVAEVKSVVAEELVLCEEKASEDAKDEVAVSRDVEPGCDKGNKEDESTKKVDEKIDEKEEEEQAVQNQECVKDSEDTKTYQDVPVKKQSFVKIMKQSLVKAKKAITGKSQNPKTPASEAKDDGNK